MGFRTLESCPAERQTPDGGPALHSKPSAPRATSRAIPGTQRDFLPRLPDHRPSGNRHRYCKNADAAGGEEATKRPESSRNASSPAAGNRPLLRRRLWAGRVSRVDPRRQVRARMSCAMKRITKRVGEEPVDGTYATDRTNESWVLWFLTAA